MGEFIRRAVHFHVPRFDLEKRVYIHEVKFKEPLPPRFSLAVRRIVGSLRSALDHAVNASKASLGNSKLNTAFPFGDDPDQFENDIKQKCCRRGVAPEVVAIIKGFKPYRGGNDDLWELNKVRNVKEHRHLVAPALAGGRMLPFEIAGKKIRMLSTSPVKEAQWDNVNKTLTFSTIPDFERQIEKKLTFFLTFGDIEGMVGEHLIPKLEAFAQVVENCIDSIETETWRLLRAR
jgi:hypothetical protein